MARSKAKLSLHRSHAIVSEYVVFLLSDSSEVSRFGNASEIRPVAPVLEKTNGVKLASSTSQIRSSYWRRFCRSWVSKMVWGDDNR